MASCEICKSTQNLRVWVKEDPYYGYGHCPTARCQIHPVHDVWYTNLYEYNPTRDDFYLVLTPV